eukprot:6843113-Prymnesium_polylepis.1
MRATPWSAQPERGGNSSSSNAVRAQVFDESAGVGAVGGAEIAVVREEAERSRQAAVVADEVRDKGECRVVRRRRAVGLEAHQRHLAQLLVAQDGCDGVGIKDARGRRGDRYTQVVLGAAAVVGVLRLRERQAPWQALVGGRRRAPQLTEFGLLRHRLRQRRILPQHRQRLVAAGCGRTKGMRVGAGRVRAQDGALRRERPQRGAGHGARPGQCCGRRWSRERRECMPA